MSRVNRSQNPDQSHGNPRCARNRSEHFFRNLLAPQNFPQNPPHDARMLKKGNGNTGALASSFEAESRFGHSQCCAYLGMGPSKKKLVLL
jgi:hypothetical protein